MGKVEICDSYRSSFPGDFSVGGLKKDYQGVIEFIIRDRNHNVIERIVEPNIIKIFAKEMLSHRLPSSQLWDPNASSGVGGWVDSGIDATEEFSARYILFGASFDDHYVPLDSDDSRFYQTDSVTGMVVPVRLTPGAEFNGSLINAIPLAEPFRPLKRVEELEYQASFQPSGNPLLQGDVRGMNNIVRLKTTLLLDEYNGMGVSDSDFFTITEVALAGGKKFNNIDSCECTPRVLFLEGLGGGSSGSSGSGAEVAIPAIANGSDVVSIDPSVFNVDVIKNGDQVMLVSRGDGKGECSISQVSPFYLVVNKLVGGRDIQLDRTPVNSSNSVITGDVGLFRDTLRIFSHRILSTPVKKSNVFEIVVIWSIIFN